MGKQAALTKKLQLKAALASKTQSKVDNPFDKFANARKKHEVLNRKVKGEDRHVGRARAKAIDDRKKKLLTDYQRTKKSSVVVDRRFGENDPSLSLEEKMFLRMQREKVKKVSRNMAQFNLEDDDGRAVDNVTLTHKGQVLGQSNLQDETFSDDEEETEQQKQFQREIVQNYHFGGGLVPVGEVGKERYRPEGRLQEVVLKSQMHKALRKEKKEDMDKERQRLDDVFDSLLTDSLVDIQPLPGRGMPRKQKQDQAEEDGVDLYDQSLQEMMYESKHQPTDRTKTEEELAVEARQRLEEAEAERLKRMRCTAEDGLKVKKRRASQKEPADAYNSVYSEIKVAKRRRNDDELDDFQAEQEEEEGLQQEEDEDSEAEGEEEEEEFGEDAFDEDELEEEDEEEEDDEEEEGLEDDEEEGEEDDDDDEADQESDVELEEEDDEEEEQAKRSRRQSRSSSSAVISVPTNGNNAYQDMPHILPCPESLAELDELIASYCPGSGWGEKAPALRELVSRILTFHSPRLPGETGQTNKQKLSKFLPVLYKHFMRLGDVMALKEADAGVVELLNDLTASMHGLVADLPEARSVNITTRLIRDLQHQWQKAISRFAQGESASCFPSLGVLLVFPLLGQLYSSSDLKHDLLDPVKLLMAQMLTQCKIEQVEDVFKGLLLCATLLDYSADSKKVLPEVNTFIAQTLLLFAPSLSQQTIFSSTSFHEGLRVLRSNVVEHGEAVDTVQWAVFGSNASDSSKAAVMVLQTLFALVETIVERYGDLSAFPELSSGLYESLRLLRPHSKPALSTSWQQRTLALLERFTNKRNEIKLERSPLQWRPPVKICVESKTPRYEVQYVFRKDRDTDKDRIKLKQLTRELKREKKAAMRELRRDSAFLDNERFQEKMRQTEESRAERVKNFAWLEEQQATLNQQVRKGKGLMELKGGGTGHLKALKRKMKR
eukprot:gene2742-2995_t